MPEGTCRVLPGDRCGRCLVPAVSSTMAVPSRPAVSSSFVRCQRLVSRPRKTATIAVNTITVTVTCISRETFQNYGAAQPEYLCLSNLSNRPGSPSTHCTVTARTTRTTRHTHLSRTHHAPTTREPDGRPSGRAAAGRAALQLRPARRPTRPRGAGPPPVGLAGAVLQQAKLSVTDSRDALIPHALYSTARQPEVDPESAPMEGNGQKL